MFRKVFDKLLSYKHGLLIILLVVAVSFFLLGGWWSQRGIIDGNRTPPENEQERRWQEQGLLFTDGVFFVGTEMKPGIYRTTGIGTSALQGCHWQRLSGFEESADNVIANHKDSYGRPSIVEIESTDKGFKTYGCGKWYAASILIADSKTSFGDGAFIVNQDIEPGTYKSDVPWGCHWERLSGFSGTYYNARLFGSDPELITESNSPVVTIKADDKGFISHGCDKWAKQPIE